MWWPKSLKQGSRDSSSAAASCLPPAGRVTRGAKLRPIRHPATTFLRNRATGPRLRWMHSFVAATSEGRSLGVARQVEDCRTLAADRGWPLGAEYIDNDVSS
jgi:hypothetical protein